MLVLYYIQHYRVDYIQHSRVFKQFVDNCHFNCIKLLFFLIKYAGDLSLILISMDLLMEFVFKTRTILS